MWTGTIYVMLVLFGALTGPYIFFCFACDVLHTVEAAVRPPVSWGIPTLSPHSKLNVSVDFKQKNRVGRRGRGGVMGAGGI